MTYETKKRNSSIELLRILMMILIIFHHYCYHGLEESSEFCIASIPVYQRVIVQLLHSGGIIANNVFSLISGYYLIANKANNRRKIQNILLEYLIYVGAISIITYVICHNPRRMIDGITSPWIGGNWYISVYIILLIFAPAINECVEHLTHDQAKLMIRLLIVFGYILPCIKLYTGFNVNCSFEGMLIMYLIGGYIRKYGFDFIPNRIIRFGINKLIISIIIIQVFVYLMIDVYADFIQNGSLNSSIMNITFLTWGGVVPIFIFAVFNNMPAFNNSIINNISKSMIAIYIIHDNPIIRPMIWHGISDNLNYIGTNMFIAHMIGKCILIFISCLFIDQAKQFVLCLIKERKI